MVEYASEVVVVQTGAEPWYYASSSRKEMNTICTCVFRCQGPGVYPATQSLRNLIPRQARRGATQEIPNVKTTPANGIALGDNTRAGGGSTGESVLASYSFYNPRRDP